MSSSDCSDIDSENRNKVLREAADTLLISDDINKSTSSSDNNHSSPEKPEKPEKPTDGPIQPTSQRYLTFDEHETDLHVNEPMQLFVHKKLSKLIADSVEFVEVSPKKSRKTSTKLPTIVKLLKDTEPINVNANIEQFSDGPQIKPIIRKRQLEPDYLTKEDKMRLASVDGNSILQQSDVQSWKARPLKESKFFRYKEKNGTMYPIDPDNEFTKARKKNNWSESKIATYKHKNLKK